MSFRIAILISGSGSNMEAIIQASQEGILQGLCEVVTVVSNKPSAQGLTKAHNQGIPSVCIQSKDKSREAFELELLNYLKLFRVDYVILAGFMRVLTSFFIGHFPKKIINIHPADTLKFQGVGGYEWAFNKNLKQTKITVHYIDSGVDTGAIIAQAVVGLSDCKTLEAVKHRGLAIEHRLYKEALASVFSEQKKQICVAF